MYRNGAAEIFGDSCFYHFDIFLSLQMDDDFMVDDGSGGIRARDENAGKADTVLNALVYNTRNRPKNFL